MILRIRNKGMLAATIEGRYADQLLKGLKENLVPAQKKETSECMAVYRINDDLALPLGSRVSTITILLWKDDTTIAVYL